MSGTISELKQQFTIKAQKETVFINPPCFLVSFPIIGIEGGFVVVFWLYLKYLMKWFFINKPSLSVSCLINEFQAVVHDAAC